MQAHIIDLRRLVRLTQNPDTLRVLREAIRTAQLQLRQQARNTRRALRDQARQVRRQNSGALRRQFPNVEWRSLNDMRVETETFELLMAGVGTQDTREGYLKSYWQGRSQQPVVSSTVV